MHGKTYKALLGYGVPSDLIEKVNARGHTLTELRALDREKLLLHYTKEEIECLKLRVDRVPIAEAVVEDVVLKSGGACCYCNDGNNTRPFQIHHVDPYSETQDNREENLLLVCPTHHVAIHANNFQRSEQKHARRRWKAIIEVASDFQQKGLVFPFGVFQALDFESDPVPGELVEFSPPSPSTSLLCYPEGLAAKASARLGESSFIMIQGASGSGKSTYAMALAGLHRKEGFKIFRHRFDKQRTDSLKHVSLFVTTCVQKAVIILDDANVWASAADLQEMGKLAIAHGKVRIIATWTTDDSDDTSRLQTTDLPKQNLTWFDLRPAVVATLIKFERDVVQVLQKYEGDHSFGSLGLGYLDSSLHTRISSLGDKAQTVYEFIFALRGDAAVAEELTEFFQDGRADIPMLCVAIEQIAGFERPMIAEEVVARCNRIESAKDLPRATPDWVNSVLHRQVSRRRLVRVRDQFRTIHRKWAARLIAAGLKLAATRDTTEELLGQEFQIGEVSPERILRLWGWLRSLDDSRPFIGAWVKSLSPEDWSAFVNRCAKCGLMEVGSLAQRMHLLFDDNAWTKTVAAAFRKSTPQIAPLVYNASNADWYWLQELARTMDHTCPDSLKEILLGWNPQKAAQVLLGTNPKWFDTITWFFSAAKTSCPGWLEEVGKYVSWEDLSKQLAFVEKGDLRSLFDTPQIFSWLGHKRRRSMYRQLAEAMKITLKSASLDDIEMPTFDADLVSLCMFFPKDAVPAFESLDVKSIGQEMTRMLPRHWNTLLHLGMCADWCGSGLASNLILATDLARLEDQARRYGPKNRYELRLLLHFMRHAPNELRQSTARNLADLIKQVSAQRDSEAQSILTAYCGLDSNLGSALANELGIIPQMTERTERESLRIGQQAFEAKDATGEDYEIDFDKEIVEQRPA